MAVACSQSARDDKTPPVSVPADVAAPATLQHAASGPVWYRAVLTGSDGSEFPFFLRLPSIGNPDRAVIKVGDYETATEAAVDGKSVRVLFNVSKTALEAKVEANGALDGVFVASWKGLGPSSMKLSATRVDAPDLAALATVSGETPSDLGNDPSVWRLVLSDKTVGKLRVTQVGPGNFKAILSTDAGDIVYLAGNGRRSEMVLTGFDGTTPTRVGFMLGPDKKTSKGTYQAGDKLDSRETFTATRGPDFELKPTLRPTRPGVKISMAALAGLEGRPVMLELAGSWCSTCRDAAPFLAEIYKTYHPRGLEVVTLLYEFTDDAGYNALQVQTYKKAFGVTWKVVPMAGDIDHFLDITPPELADLTPSGFPVTMFLDANHSLREVHAGFPAPSAKEEYAQVTAKYRTNIEAILASKPGPAKQKDR